jgi:putative phosphonate metabolism protein
MRYAIYFSPPDADPLSRLAAQWLGRNAFTDEPASQVQADGFDADEIRQLTDEPRRYGFHATLKAPMELASGCSEDELLAAFAAFAGETDAFDIPQIVLGQLGAFFALVPADRYDALQAFAAACVERFEPFRAPLSEADIARRKPEKLSESERANLMRWGYPYVFDDFRFHMTLTGQVPAERQPPMRAALAAIFADLINRPLAVSHVSLFIEPERGAPFVMKSILPLRPLPQRKSG